MAAGPERAVWTIHRDQTPTEVALSVTDWRATSGTGVPVLLLHGFTGTGGSMGAIAERLVPRRCLAPDALGHGRSSAPPDPGRYTMASVVADLVAVLDQAGIATVHLVGYSMGGRMALTFAAASPQRVSTLSLIGASAGLATAAERSQRRDSDAALAARIENDGIEAFVDSWEALPLFASQAQLAPEVAAAQRATRLRQEPRGLANALRGCGTGSMPPLHDQLASMQMPTLVLAGALDTKYCELGRQLATAMPAARFAEVAGVGHAAHLEAPAHTAALLAEFLDAHP